MFLSPISVVLLIILIIGYFYKNAKNRPKNFPPGPPRLPFWGSYWFMLKKNYQHPHLSFEKLAHDYQTAVLGLYLGNAPTIVALSNKLCKEMLCKDEFLGRNDTIITRTRGLGELRGIFFIDGDFWKDERRFSLRNLRDFGFGRRFSQLENFVDQEIENMVDLLNNHADTPSDICREKGVFLFPDIFYAPLLSSILQIVASTKFDALKLREFARAGLRFQRSGDATGAAISMTPWLRHLAPDFFGYTPVITDNGLMLDFVREIVDEHLRTFSKDNYRDFIDVYIGERYAEGQELDYDQLILLILDYIFPAAIAIGQTLSFFFAYMVKNPRIQKKIQEEIDGSIGQSRLPNLDDRKSMPYLEATLRESMRITPLNPLGIPRRCTEDTEFAGFFVPKDTIILPCVWTAHRDPSVWDNPEIFNPDRFLDESGNLLKKDYTLGFGAGKRLCAGETFARQTMFQIVASLLQNFNFKSPDGLNFRFEIVPGVNLSLDENWIKVEPR